MGVNVMQILKLARTPWGQVMKANSTKAYIEICRSSDALKSAEMTMNGAGFKYLCYFKQPSTYRAEGGSMMFCALTL